MTQQVKMFAASLRTILRFIPRISMWTKRQPIPSRYLLTSTCVLRPEKKKTLIFFFLISLSPPTTVTEKAIKFKMK